MIRYILNKFKKNYKFVHFYMSKNDDKVYIFIDGELFNLKNNDSVDTWVTMKNCDIVKLKKYNSSECAKI